jgi:hypothetical protein
MKKNIILLLSFAYAIGIIAQTTNNVVITFDHTVGGTPLVVNETIFPIWNNKNILLTRAEFYLSEVELQKNSSTTIPLEDQYMLVNANAPAAEFDLGAFAIDAIESAVLHIGVPESINHLDPASYDANHPLAPKNPSMHWGWTAGYRFMAIEGKVDNDNDGIPETNFEFHNLGDVLYKLIKLVGTKEAENGTLALHFILDYAELFKTLNLTSSLIQHGSSPNTNGKMMSNAITQGFMTLESVTATPEIALNSQNVVAMPNPFATETRIDYILPVGNNVTMIVTNSLGQVVKTFFNLPATGSVRFEKGTLSGGAYQAIFYENKNILARKLLIVN